MTTRNILVAAVLAVFVVAGALYGWYFLHSDGSGNTAQTVVGVETASILEETERYKIDVKYPQFGISEVDSKIKEGVDTFVVDFKKEAEKKTKEEQPYELTSSFGGVYADDLIISARLSVSKFTGGAHPGTTIFGLNYAKATGQEISLESALKLIGATLEQVSEHASAQLKSKLGDSFVKDGATPKPENYWMFTINEKGVTFIFNEYQVAPYAAGPQRVSFARAP